MAKLSRMTITPGNGGVTVEHHYEPEKGKEFSSYTRPESYPFNSHADAMEHIHGKMKEMDSDGDCPMCSPSGKKDLSKNSKNVVNKAVHNMVKGKK